VASLALDIPDGEEGFERRGANPLLVSMRDEAAPEVMSAPG
jgi:formate dehydrogenase maturation protein FdhE